MVESIAHEPQTDEQVAETLRDAAARGVSVVVRGGGTKLGWGSAMPVEGETISTARLDGIVDLEPGDFVCVVRAGTRLSDLQAELARHPEYRQRLMLDPSHGPEQTVGGIVAANASGPLRHRYGAPRDLVLGARFVLSDGTVAKTGGRVVKNVAGYDMSKLLCGSLGTLAVVTEVAVKLHPLPERSETVVFAGDSEAIARVARSLRTAPVDATCVEVIWPEGVIAVRIASSVEGAVEQARRVVDLAEGARRLPAEDATDFWTRHEGRPYGGDGVVLGFGVPPAALRRLLQLADGLGASLVARAGVGVGEVRLDPEAVLAVRGTHRRARRRTSRCGERRHRSAATCRPTRTPSRST